MNIIKRTMNTISRYSKLIKLLSSIDILENDNSMIVKIKKNLILTHDGNIILTSNKGSLVTSHKSTHINPNIKITVLESDDIVTKSERSVELENLNRKKSLFVNALKNNRVIY